MPGSRGLTCPASGKTGTAPVIMAGALWPQPGGPLFVTVGYVDLPTRQRFVRAWDATWARLPMDVRGTILRHWQRADLTDLHGRPRVVLCPSLPDTAHVTSDGFVLRVALDVIADWPEARVVDLLGHELGHTFLAATGQRWWTDALGDAEHDVEWLRWSWGFGAF